MKLREMKWSDSLWRFACHSLSQSPCIQIGVAEHHFFPWKKITLCYNLSYEICSCDAPATVATKGLHFQCQYIGSTCNLLIDVSFFVAKYPQNMFAWCVTVV